MEQFLAHFIAHGIRDDHHGALLGILDNPGIEVPLQGQLREGIRLLHGAVPLGQQRLQILVGVDVLHEVTQRLKGRGVLNPVIGRVEAAVLVIKPGVCFLILPQDVLEAVRAVIISGLNHLVCAAEHLIPAFCFRSEVHLASLLAELGDGQLA